MPWSTKSSPTTKVWSSSGGISKKPQGKSASTKFTAHQSIKRIGNVFLAYTNREFLASTKVTSAGLPMYSFMNSCVPPSSTKLTRMMQCMPVNLSWLILGQLLQLLLLCIPYILQKLDGSSTTDYRTSIRIGAHSPCGTHVPTSWRGASLLTSLVPSSCRWRATIISTQWTYTIISQACCASTHCSTRSWLLSAVLNANQLIGLAWSLHGIWDPFTVLVSPLERRACVDCTVATQPT